MDNSAYHLVSDDYDESATLEQDTQAALHTMAYRSSSVDFALNDGEREIVKSRTRTLSVVNRKKSSMDVEHPAALLNTDEPEVTVRGMVIGSLVGGVVGAQNVYFAFKLGWSMGISTTSAILGFALMSFYTQTSWGSKLPFGPKENCCIQTAAVAAASMSSASGLAVGLFALTTQFQEYQGTVYGGAKTYDMSWSQQLIWCYGILLFGFFVAIPLRRQLVVKYQLPFPSGQATAYVMRAMHTTKDGTPEGWIQFRMLVKSFVPCSIWYTLKGYMYSGLDSIPFFGMKAMKYYWYSDLSTAFIGCGIMISSRFSISWFLGALVGWALIIPYVDQNKAGIWFDGPDKDSSYSLTQISGPFGYILFPAIAMMLIDSVYEISKIFYQVYLDHQQKKNESNSQGLLNGDNVDEPVDVVPEKDIGRKVWIPGMLLFMFLGCLVGYLIFPHVTFPQLLVASLIGPLGATGILYGQGLTDTGMGVVFSKLAIMLLCVWNPNSYIAPLVGGCLVYTCLSQAGDLMQDFKTAYLIGASPRSMLLSQVIGSVTAPWWAIAAYHLYTSSADIPSQEFPCLSSVSWLGLVQVFTEGFSALPKNCLYFVLVGSIISISLKILEDKVDEKYHKWIPSVMPFTIGMYSTPQFATDVLIGCIARQIWLRKDREGFNKSYAIICAGLVAGEGVTSLLIAMLQAFSGRTAWLLATWGTYK